MANLNGGNTSGYVLSNDLALEEVLDIEANALRSYKEGRLIVKWNDNGQEVEKKIIAPPAEILAECNRWKKVNYPHIYGYVVRQSNMRRLG